MNQKYNTTIQQIKASIASVETQINNNYNKYVLFQLDNQMKIFTKQLLRYNNTKLIINVFNINNNIYMSKKEYTDYIVPNYEGYGDIIIATLYNTFLRINDDPNRAIPINHNDKIFNVYKIELLWAYLLLCHNTNDKNEFIYRMVGITADSDTINLYEQTIKYLELYIEFNIIDYKPNSIIQSEIINNLESKFDKKFNDLFENTSDIIKELKKDLEHKNEKIRNLELEVHYLKSQSEKKVTIDYEAIKQKNKLLNNEFKRIYKLMKFSNE